MKKLNFTDEEMVEIYNLYKGSRLTNGDIARKYGICIRSVYNIRKEVDRRLGEGTISLNIGQNQMIGGGFGQKHSYTPQIQQHHMSQLPLTQYNYGQHLSYQTSPPPVSNYISSAPNQYAQYYTKPHPKTQPTYYAPASISQVESNASYASKSYRHAKLEDTSRTCTSRYGTTGEPQPKKQTHVEERTQPQSKIRPRSMVQSKPKTDDMTVLTVDTSSIHDILMNQQNPPEEYYVSPKKNNKKKEIRMGVLDFLSNQRQLMENRKY